MSATNAWWLRERNPTRLAFLSADLDYRQNLDETLAHLDHQTVGHVLAWLADWRAGRLILIAHHGTLPIEADQALAVSGMRP